MFEAPPESPDEFFMQYLPSVVGSGAVALGDRTSLGSLTFRVPGVGEWSLRVRDGELAVLREAEDDVVIQLTVPPEDFVPLIVDRVRGAAGAVERQGTRMLFKALDLDAETARLIRHVPGSILLEAMDGAVARRLLITPGRRHASLVSPDCTIRVAFDDLIAVQRGERRAMDLFTSGKLQLSGNVQLALALSGLFL